MGIRYMICMILLLTISLNAFATFILPNGEASYGIQYDANSDYLGQHKNSVAPEDQTTITTLSETYNTLVVDVPAKFVWTKYSGNPNNDFNFDAYDALCAYAYTKGMYCGLQMIVDTTGYWNVDYFTFLDTNFPDLNKTVYQTNYPSTSPSYTTDNNKLSIYSPDTNKIYFYANQAMANHYASNPAIALYISNPNEGFSSGLAPQNTIDANKYWQQTCLPSYYANIAAANTAYGKSYAAFTNVPIPTDRTNFNPTHQYDWWKCKSERASKLYAENARALKTPNSSKLVTTIKLLPDYLFPSGLGNVGYTYGMDTNVLVAYSSPWVDAVACDVYPDTANVKNQAVILDERIAYCKGLGDLIGKPIYLAEFYNSTTAGNDATHDANSNSTMLAQALAYVGETTNSGVRGLSVFTYNGGYGDKRDIKGTANESLFAQKAKESKYVLRYATNSIADKLAICDNTNINVAFNIDYWRHDQLDGFLNLYRRNDNNLIKFYFNSDCNKATEPVMYANPVNIWSSHLLDLNAWVASGHTLITGFRFADGNETNRRTDGWESTGTQVSGRTPLGDYLTGLTGTTTSVQANKLFDVNIAATETLFTSLATPTRIFSFQTAASDRNVDYEVGTIGAGAVTEAIITRTTGSGTGGPAITSRVIGSGKAIHFAFNLLGYYSGKNADLNANTGYRDILVSAGKAMSGNNYNNFFAWSNPYYTAINAYGTTTGTLNVPVTGTQALVVKTDFNTLTFSTETTTPGILNYAPALTSGQTKSIYPNVNLTMNIGGDTYVSRTSNTITTLPVTSSQTGNTATLVNNTDSNLKSVYVLNEINFCNLITNITLTNTETGSSDITSGLSCTWRTGHLTIPQLNTGSNTMNFTYWGDPASGKPYQEITCIQMVGSLNIVGGAFILILLAGVVGTFLFIMKKDTDEYDLSQSVDLIIPSILVIILIAFATLFLLMMGSLIC